MKNNEWEATKTELYAEKWWAEHGYSAKLDSRMLTKSVYNVTKGGHTEKYEIPMQVKDKKRFMEIFEEFWVLACKLKGVSA